MEFTSEQQTIVNKLVGDARTKAREKADAEYAAEAAKKKEAADAAAMVAKQEWEKLAQKHEARVKELEPLAEQVKAYEALVGEMLTSRVKALGDSAKKALAGLPAGMTSIERLAWLNSNEELFQAAGSDGVGTPGRSKTKPKPIEPKTGVGQMLREWHPRL